MIENDAFWTAPDIAAIRKRAVEKDVAEGDAADELLRERAANIAAAKGDPFRFGYEPDIWLVCRAMLGLERIPDMIRHALAWRTGFDEARCWQRWRDQLCDRMGLKRYIVELMLNGANRSSKTDFGAKVCHETGLDLQRKIWVGSPQWQNSKDTVQERVHRYIPQEWRKDIRSSSEYNKWSDQNGFTQNSFINRMGSKFKFIFYTQKRENALEGPECHMAWMDEDVPQNWLEGLRMRIASVHGRMLITFTPVSGYTPAVAEYLGGMRVIRRCHAYMLPRDGGKALPWRALGISREEYAQLLRRSDVREEMPQTVPSSRSEDCVRWGMEPWRESDENAEPGRVWEMVPRVALCRDSGKAIVWFQCRDNPYGNPIEVIRTAGANTNALDEIKKRVYGIALKAKGKRFKMFDRAVHVVAGDGEGRDVSRPYEVLCYREWPGADEVAGHGVPEPWAKRSSRKKGLNDGDPDGGQDKFGFGVLRYKFEIARLEGWKDWADWVANGCPGYEDGGCPVPYDEDLETWSDGNGSRDNVAYRIVDGRACVQSKIGMMADKTLIDLLNEAGMSWEPASGAKIGSGEDRINEALAWVRGNDGVMTKRPGLVFSERCKNHIFAMENYMGEDGQKGACKEPVDTLRYLYQSGLTENPPERDMNVLVMDPAPERNWFMSWYRIRGAGGGSEAGGRRPEVGMTEENRPEAGGGGRRAEIGRRRTEIGERREECGGGWDAGR